MERQPSPITFRLRHETLGARNVLGAKRVSRSVMCQVPTVWRHVAAVQGSGHVGFF